MLFSVSRLSSLTLCLQFLLCAQAQTKVLISNDDGWAEANIRALYHTLNDANGTFDVILSAPAENESGQGSSDAPPTTVGSSGCEFNTCAAGSPAEGNNASDTRLNYVNSFPVTAVKYGLSTLAPKFFNSSPDIVLTGPNVGNNLGSTVLISGTVGAAAAAAMAGVPAIGFSGAVKTQETYTILSGASSEATAAKVFADLSIILTQTLLSSTTQPILPANVTLNVNFPAVTGSCGAPENFKFVLSRINSNSSAMDLNTCGADHLPTESTVIDQGGCLSSVSVMNATTKGDVNATMQAFVQDKLSSILTCSSHSSSAALPRRRFPIRTIPLLLLAALDLALLLITM